jgi:Peroxidase, family 2
VFGHGEGLAQAHGRFEADASVTRWDWGTKLGLDASTVNINYFKVLYNDPEPDGTYSFDKWLKYCSIRWHQSVETNPCVSIPR